MANIIDYLKWRGDIPFSADPLNEIDALILCQFEYIKLEGVVSSQLNEKITLANAYRIYSGLKFEDADKNISFDQDCELFRLMADSRRFGSMLISGYVNIVSNEEDKQFSAITCFPDDDSIFVVFRGTDGSIVGWKEDFMLCYVNCTPSQQEALNYLENNFKGVNCSIRIGGHSKGGNLSVYAAMMCSEDIRKKIASVYNFDGPGFREEIVESTEYRQVLPYIRSYIPEGSIFGRLLGSNIEHQYVKNSVSGVMQHLSYNWQLERNHFLRAKKPSKSGDVINKTISGWLNDFDDSDRENFVNTLFNVLGGNDRSNVSELKGVKNYTSILKAVSDLEPKEQTVLTDALKKIIKSGKGAIFPNDDDKK